MSSAPFELVSSEIRVAIQRAIYGEWVSLGLQRPRSSLAADYVADTEL
jgi:hypothetical protein